MGKALDLYLDLWARFFWPLAKIAGFAWGLADKVKIWLIGDLFRMVLLGMVVIAGGFYAALFMFAMPVSLYLLLSAMLAVAARTYSRRLGGQEGPAPIRAGFFHEISSMSAWASVGFILLSGAQLWLNWRETADPVQFAAFEANVLDATAALRRAASFENALIALGALIAAAFLFRTMKPLVVLGTVRQAASAMLAIAAVVTTFSFVTAQAAGERHDRSVGEIVPRMRASLDAAVRDRQETAAMRWAAAELAARPRPVRARLLDEIAAAQARANALCAEERAHFQTAFADAVATNHPGVEAAPAVYDPDAAAQNYCDGARLLAEALRPAVHAARAAADAAEAIEAPDSGEWKNTILEGERPDVVRALSQNDPLAVGSDLSIRELRAGETRLAGIAGEAARARAAVRETLLDGVTALLGPEYKGVAAPVLEALQRAVLNSSALRIENELLSWWKPGAPAARFTGEGVEVHLGAADDVHLATLSEAHGVPAGRGSAQVADDVVSNIWKVLRPSGGAVGAAEAAVAAALAARMATMHPSVRGARVKPRIPRIRI